MKLPFLHDDMMPDSGEEAESYKRPFNIPGTVSFKDQLRELDEEDNMPTQTAAQLQVSVSSSDEELE